MSNVENLREEDQEIVRIEQKIINQQKIYIGTDYRKQKNAPINEA